MVRIEFGLKPIRRVSSLGLCTVLLAMVGVSACQTGPDIDPRADLSVSIPYDPYNYNPESLDIEAQAHCDAYGLHAQFEDETIDNQSVRWRYRHYVCI